MSATTILSSLAIILSLLIVAYNWGVGLRLAAERGFDVSALSDFSTLMISSNRCAEPETTLADRFPKALACSQVNQRINNNSAQDSARLDPNGGFVYARKTIGDPQVWISVHNQSYDPLWWRTLYERGKYYEHVVLYRFNKILGRQTAPSPTAVENVIAHTKNNCLVMDVGANIGYYSMVAAAHGCDVIAFELLPSNLFRYCQSVRLNSFDAQVALYQHGVSDVAGSQLHVRVDRKNPGKSSLRPAGESRLPGDETVTTVTLDSFSRDHRWLEAEDDSGGTIAKKNRIKLLKIDVEGGEFRVMEGAQDFLLHGLAEHVLLEMRFGGNLYDPAVKMVAILFQGGYMVRDAPQNVQNPRTGNFTHDAEVFLTQLRKVTRLQRMKDMWFYQPNE